MGTVAVDSADSAATMQLAVGTTSMRQVFRKRRNAADGPTARAMGSPTVWRGFRVPLVRT
jgi:hypothetical protein